MISIGHQGNLITATVLGEFTLADFKDFEQQLAHQVEFQGKVNLLLDLGGMLSYTLDVAWEDVKFTRQHAYDFGKIAIITTDQWVIWSAWLSNLFVDAEIQIYDDVAAAQAWLNE